MAAIFVTAMLVLPFWEFASRKWNKRKAYAGGIAFWAVVQIVLITLSPSVPLPVILGLCVLAGRRGQRRRMCCPGRSCRTRSNGTNGQTGERHEGMFYSLVTLAQKAASSVAIPFILLILQFTGYVPTSNVQPPSALLGIRLAIGPIPALLLCCGIAFAIFYPLDRESHRRIVLELEARRSAAAEEAK